MSYNLSIKVEKKTCPCSPMTNSVDAQHSWVQGPCTAASHLPGLDRGWGAWSTSGLNPFRPGVTSSYLLTSLS